MGGVNRKKCCCVCCDFGGPPAIVFGSPSGPTPRGFTLSLSGVVVPGVGCHDYHAAGNSISWASGDPNGTYSAASMSPFTPPHSPTTTSGRTGSILARPAGPLTYVVYSLPGCTTNYFGTYFPSSASDGRLTVAVTLTQSSAKGTFGDLTIDVRPANQASGYNSFRLFYASAAGVVPSCRGRDHAGQPARHAVRAVRRLQLGPGRRGERHNHARLPVGSQMSLGANITTCHRCPRRQVGCSGACACEADPARRDILELAALDACPEGRFTSRGLGDTVAKAAHALGLDKAAAVLSGGDCGGCAARQAVMNKLMPYAGGDAEAGPVRPGFDAPSNDK